MNWQDVRTQFPALEHWTYLNTATFGQLPRRAVAAMERHLARRDEFACQDFLSWFDDVDLLRGQLGLLINCQAEDIAYVPNASTALSLLFGGLDWKPGDQVLTLENEFPNHYYLPPRLMQAGVELVETPFDRFYEAVNERTRLVALSTVSYATGFRAPVAEIAAFLRARGVLFYLDGTQSLGALQFDASAIRPDMFAVNGYKWLCCPNGAAFMYVSPELRKKLDPATVGWRSDRNWRDFAMLNHGAAEFVEAAEKYEGGMLPFAPLYGMAESVALMLELGPDKIEARVLELAGLFRETLSEFGATIAHEDTPILAALFPDRVAGELVTELKSRRILTAARHGRLRISPHFYNDITDLEKLRSVLKVSPRQVLFKN
jgi:cysteine desulfurase / selenocysteine lyase